jgi:hypothetical protein
MNAASLTGVLAGGTCDDERHADGGRSFVDNRAARCERRDREYGFRDAAR